MEEEINKRRHTFIIAFKQEKVKQIEYKQIKVAQIYKLYQVSNATVYKWIELYGSLKQKVERVVVEKESESNKTAELERLFGQKQVEVEYWLLVSLAGKPFRQFGRKLCRPIGGKTMRSQVRCWQRQGVKEGLASLRNVTKVNRFWHVFGARLLKVPIPKVRTLLHVLTDGFANRKVRLTRGSLYSRSLFLKGLSKNKSGDKDLLWE